MSEHAAAVSRRRSVTDGHRLLRVVAASFLGCSLTVGAARAQEVLAVHPFTGSGLPGSFDVLDPGPNAKLLIGLPYGDLGDIRSNRLLVRKWNSSVDERALLGGSSGAYMGQFVARLGDLTGDGFEDFGFQGGSGVSIVDGITYEQLAFHRGAAGLWRLGDLDSDGCVDYFMREFGLVSGASGKRLNPRPMALQNPVRLGYMSAPRWALGAIEEDWVPARLIASVIAVPDWNQDGVDDLLAGWSVGDPGAPVEDNKWDCCAFAYSGLDGEPLSGQRLESANTHFGGSLVVVGDLNGDGLAEYAVGAVDRSGEHCALPESGAAFAAGSVLIYDGATKQVWNTLCAERGTHAAGPELLFGYGRQLAVIGDLNANGSADLLIPFSLGFTSPEIRVAARDPLTGETLWDVSAQELAWPARDVPASDSSSVSSLNGTVKPTGDVNDDGFKDWAVRVYHESTLVVSGAPRGVRSVGSAHPQLGGSTIAIGVSGSPQQARGSLRVNAAGLERNARVYLLQSQRADVVELSSSCRVLLPDRASLTSLEQRGAGLFTTFELALSKSVNELRRATYIQWVTVQRRANGSAHFGVSRVLKFTLQP